MPAHGAVPGPGGSAAERTGLLCVFVPLLYDVYFSGILSGVAGLGRRNLRGALARNLEAATSVPVLVAPPSTRKRSDRRLAAAADGD
jgi:hypothetical protein